MKTETLIIGGGLSGLSLAAQLAQAGRDVRLIEARERLGGRILSEYVGPGAFDLGPAWFWPGQPRIARLIADLGLTAFEQYAGGILTYEDARGVVERGRGYASMQGSLRVKGGLGAMIDALAARLPDDLIVRGTCVSGLEQIKGGIRAISATGEAFEAKRVVLALPPRLASQMAFTPPLPASAHDAMDSIPTWMAGQAKAVAVYDSAFWRQAGLSGDAMSRHGPLVEIHDASAEGTAGPFALFGFIGVPPTLRQDRSALEAAILAQLDRLFGPPAATPKALFIKDWAHERYTSTPRDQQPLHTHPAYGLPPALQGLWEGRVIFGGTETAAHFGGYLEGALEAAETALALCSHEEVCPQSATTGNRSKNVFCTCATRAGSL